MVAAGQGHDVLAIGRHSDHRGIGMLVIEQRANGAQDDAAGHQGDDWLALQKGGGEVFEDIAGQGRMAAINSIGNIFGQRFG